VSGGAAEPSRDPVARLTTLTDLDMESDVEERARLWNALYLWSSLDTYQVTQ